MGTARGLLLTLVGVGFIGMMILPSLFAPVAAKMAGEFVIGFRRFAPLALLAYCLLILLFTPGEKAFAFTPAEVSFLFPGPFSRRALLAYKIGGNLALTFLSGVFIMYGFRQYWRIWIAGYLGVVLMFAFVQLFQIGVTVIGQAVGAAASTRRRQLAVVLILGLAVAAVLSTGVRVQIVTAPFRPFVYTVTALHIWPDMVSWGALALGINSALIALILAVDSQYLEAAAAGSERLYAKIERMRKGGPSISSLGKNKKWRSLGALPWWGGVGPILWRQLTSASRDYGRALAPFLITLSLAGMGIFLNLSVAKAGNDGPGMAFGFGIVALALAISSLLTFDFRGDFERMEGLKSLPMRPIQIVLGQLAAPWVLLCSSQFLALAILVLAAGPFPSWYWLLPVFAPLFNLLLLEVDNLWFLLYPKKPTVHTPGDVQELGRAMVMMTGKMLILGSTLGLVAVFGFLAYLAAGLIAAALVSWLVVLGMIALFVPLLGMAFSRFDVASDTAD
jgi:hypothetical protein